MKPTARRPSRAEAEVERSLKDLQTLWKPPPEIKKDPATLEGGPGFQKTFSSFNYSACAHENSALVKIDCRAGGTQYRRFCLRCWSPVGTAIPHALAHAEEARSGIEAPIADLEVIHAAQEFYRRRRYREAA